MDNGYHIRYYYNDPYQTQFRYYRGVLNLLDRDCWNNRAL